MAKTIYSLSLFLLLLAGCKNTPKPNPTVDISAWDTLSGIKRLDTDSLHIALNRYGVLFVYNRKTHHIDSLELKDVEPNENTTRLTNLTRSLSFDRLALLIDWQGDSDNMYSTLVGYMGDTLKVIYADPNPGGIKELHRKDQWTITGLSFGEDSLTGDRNILCPLTISLRTGEGEIRTPDISTLLFDTQAKEPIAAWRFRKPGDSVAFTIPAGAAFRIDTVDNTTKTAVLSLGDSVILRTRFEELHSKFAVSDAG